MKNFRLLIASRIIGLLLACVLVTSLTGFTSAKTILYPVKPGDTLGSISSRFNCSIAELRATNKIVGDKLNIGQILRISTGGGFWNYTVKYGDTFYLLAQRLGTSIADLKQINNILTDNLLQGQILVIPEGPISPPTAPPAGTGEVYTVKPGDTLYLISQRFGISVDELWRTNKLTSDYLYVGQQLIIPERNTPTPPPEQEGTIYTVKAGDTLFLIGLRFGVSVAALRQANELTSDYLAIGQQLLIPTDKPTPPPAGGSDVYVVKPGDTLYLIGQRFGVSVAALRQANNLYTDYLNIGQTLIIPKGNPSQPPPSGQISLSPQEKDLFARLVTAEAAAEPYEGQVAVAAVILNRLKSPNYPNDLTSVIYQVENGYYQFCPVENGTINLPAVASAFQAVEEALNGRDPSGGAIGFYNPANTTNSWIRSRPITTVIGAHVFYR